MKLWKRTKVDIELDSKLESDAQRAVAIVVKSLADDDLSMGWRSQLNERLAAVAPQTRRRSLAWRLARPVAGFAIAASVFTGLALMNLPKAAQPGIEGSLVSAATASTVSAEVSGSGLRYYELDRQTRGEVEEDWTEYDLGVL